MAVIRREVRAHTDRTAFTTVSISTLVIAEKSGRLIKRGHTAAIVQECNNATGFKFPPTHVRDIDGPLHFGLVILQGQGRESLNPAHHQTGHRAFGPFNRERQGNMPPFAAVACVAADELR